MDVQQVAFLKEAADKSNVIFAVLGTPYITHLFSKSKSLYIGYEDNEYTNMVAYSIFKNQYKASGKLPVSLQFGKKKV